MYFSKNITYLATLVYAWKQHKLLQQMTHESLSIQTESIGIEYFMNLPLIQQIQGDNAIRDKFDTGANYTGKDADGEEIFSDDDYNSYNS